MHRFLAADARPLAVEPPLLPGPPPRPPVGAGPAPAGDFFRLFFGGAPSAPARFVPALFVPLPLEPLAFAGFLPALAVAEPASDSTSSGTSSSADVAGVSAPDALVTLDWREMLGASVLRGRFFGGPDLADLARRGAIAWWEGFDCG